MNPQPTERLAWIGRCVWRLKRMYGSGAAWPNGQPLSWAQYMQLIACVLAEYRTDDESQWPGRS